MKDPSTGNPPFCQVAHPLKVEDEVFVGIMRLKNDVSTISVEL